MIWITREGAKVDRIACPWLIRKFIDPQAEFRYVPRERVLEEARRTAAIPYDTPGAQLTHYVEDGVEYVSFDAIIREYKLTDPALLELAKIVRTADGGTATAPEGPGLSAAATGFRAISPDDLANLRIQFPLYDALYAYCQTKTGKVGRP